MNYELKQAIVKVAEKAVMNALDADYMEECGQNAGEVYWNEYGHYNGTTSEDCKDYLQGLPSLCTVPFYNNEIIDLIEKEAQQTIKDDSVLCDMVEYYWICCGKAFRSLL